MIFKQKDRVQYVQNTSIYGYLQKYIGRCGNVTINGFLDSLVTFSTILVLWENNSDLLLVSRKMT